MGNPAHLEILKQGVDVWNRWREDNPDIKPDLSFEQFSDEKGLGNVHFPRINFTDTSLIHTNLLESNLNRAILIRAELRMANLSQSKLCQADLSMADLSHTLLTGTDFSKADLSMTNFTNAFFEDTILFDALFDNTFLIDVDLSKVKGLESARHFGFSYLDIYTIYRSKGNVPFEFLRDVGIPENFIDFISSFTESAFDYYSCFISYSSNDQEFTEQLFEDMQNKGVRCWYAPEEMKIGDKIRDRIDKSVRSHDKLLLVLSEHSLNSNWVEDEVESAYEQEQSRGTTVLFPIRLDDAVMVTDKAWAAKLRRSRHIGDFTSWKDLDFYQNAFDRLLRDLKAED